MDTKLNHVQNYFASDPTQSSCPCPETELWQSEFRSVQVLSQSGAVEEHVLHYGQPHSGLSAWTFVRARPLVVRPPGKGRLESE
jgi:hypothetical protein